MQRKLALKSLLESSGIKLFNEELQLHIDCVINKVDKHQSECVNLETLSELNYDLGKKAGLEIVLSILRSFKEELENKSSGDVKPNSKE